MPRVRPNVGKANAVIVLTYPRGPSDLAAKRGEVGLIKFCHPQVASDFFQAEVNFVASYCQTDLAGVGHSIGQTGSMEMMDTQRGPNGVLRCRVQSLRPEAAKPIPL